ncbi:cAMP-binding domain of CRP or a regulatory subunit of cAMP-dependent protein kinases [Bowdeniella nasicola]|uniref:cAMP-binding domain of CRP or a regulatory subunit of cAMP-dependent protein kinases n=1 Tax=Bowdeniella nasicola TaxID=208480 RepID=A0A1H3X114_9ACTO|nr:Crp/Fnr family transcriptional regulator [Bowdeniella nasicola]SDZ93095.1 cAMP-binding domain of CRP or a regulatory subunit of cAMP-dependent protein kinases [Bowdeniella nasicola]
MARNPVRSSCAHPHECSLEVRLKVLARSPLTSALSREDHLDLDRYLTALGWAAGDPLILAGEQAHGTLMVVAGRVRITKDTIDGREVTVDIAGPGDIIGPLHTFASPATESAWAMETSCTLYLPATALETVVQRYPTIALAIMRMQQEQLARSRARKTAQATTSVEQRVAATLAHLDAKFGDSRHDGSRLLQVRLRREDIAGMAGTTIESASRTLAKMKAAGTIDSGREWIAITDRDALAELAAS